MGLNYKIIYKKGADNKVADALSRVSSTNTYDLSALSVVKPLWLQEVQASYIDPQSVQLLAGLSVSSPQGFYTPRMFLSGIKTESGLAMMFNFKQKY
jgi:hypothetical protein